MPRARTNVERTPTRRPRSGGHGSRAGHRTERARQRTRRTGGPLALFIPIFISLGVSVECAEAQTISSGADQLFTIGGGPLPSEPLTITATAAGQIEAATDIRIRIPATFNAIWDTTITTVVISGTAAHRLW